MNVLAKSNCLENTWIPHRFYNNCVLSVVGTNRVLVLHDLVDDYGCRELLSSTQPHCGTNVCIHSVSVGVSEHSSWCNCGRYDTLTITQAVIFCNTKRKVDWLTEKMREANFTVSVPY